jgi:hypothetical protein
MSGRRNSRAGSAHDAAADRAEKYFLDCTAISFITGVVLAAPLTGATAGALANAADIDTSAALCIDRDFIREVEGLIEPGTSALFVLDEVGEMDKVMQSIRGLGGTVLKTNVYLDRAKLVQATLAAAWADPIEANNRRSTRQADRRREQQDDLHSQ